MKKKKLAFTLAEVLITLTILGVVAAIATPNLIRNYQKRMTVTRVAKGYSTLEGAVNNIAVNTNCVGKDLKCTGLLNETDSDKFAEKFVKLGGMRITPLKRKWYTFSSLGCYKSTGDCDGATTNPVIQYEMDKLAYVFEPMSTGYLPTHPSGELARNEAIIVTLITDTKETSKKEGDKFPRLVRGINVFYFIIYGNFIVEPMVASWNGQAAPASMKKNLSFCDIDAKSGYWGGYDCTAKIIRDGWKIKYY